MAQKQIIHPCDKLPQPAPETLHFQQGRFLITKEEFNFTVETFSKNLERIKQFSKIAVAEHYKLFEKNLMYAVVRIFSEFMKQFLDKEFVNPHSMFERICHQYPFEFLLLCDLCRET